MIPGGMDPKQMQKLMQQMGIKHEQVEVQRVIFEKTDGSRLVFEPAQVVAIIMQGQKSYQVTGDEHEEAGGPSPEDVELVMQQTGASKEAAEAALQETGDIAEAIVKLKKE